MKKVLRAITIITMSALIPVSLYLCLVVHFLETGFIGVCAFQALLLLLVLNKPGILFSVQIGFMTGLPLLLFGFYLMCVTASPYYMIYGVFLLALICSYTGYKWTKERLLEHISVLSKGKLDAKIRAVTLYIRSGGKLLFTIGAIVASEFLFIGGLLPLPKDSFLMPFLRVSAFYIGFMAILIIAERKRIHFGDSCIRVLADSGTLEQAANDFTAAKDYLWGSVRGGDSYVYGYHAGWIFPYNQVSEMRLTEGSGRGGTGWQLKIVVGQKEYFLHSEMLGKAKDSKVREQFKNEVYPLFLQIRTVSHCVLRVINLDGKVSGPKAFLG